MITQASTQTWRTRLSLTAWIALVVHLLAGLTMALILRNGVATNLDLAARLTFLTNERALWITGWIPWNLAAVCILACLYCFSEAYKREVSSPAVLKYAVIICAVAVLCDLSAQSRAMLLLPDLAALTLADPAHLGLFNELYRSIVLSSGVAGNTGYTIATLIAAWSARTEFPRWVTWTAILIGVVGAGVTLACLLDSTMMQVITNAALIPLLTVWFAGVAITARRPATEDEEMAPNTPNNDVSS